MNKGKKLINTLAALSGEITVRSIEEMQLKNGKTRFDICVNHAVHSAPCSCGSKMIKKHGTKSAWAMHIPQGKRSTTRIHYDRQRFKCKTCGATFLEDISWIHNGSHLTVSLFDCIASDVRTLMTKNGSLTFSGNDLKILVVHQYFFQLSEISWEALIAPLFSGTSYTDIIVFVTP